MNMTQSYGEYRDILSHMSGSAIVYEFILTFLANRIYSICENVKNSG